MRKRIQALKHGSWIDEQTRAIIIGVNFYNGNYNYYVTAQMKIEFGTTGAIKSTEKLLAFPIDVFDLNGSSQALAGEIMLFVIAVVIIGVVAEHIATAYKRGCCVHCSNFYNALSFSAYGIYFLSQMLRLGLLVDPSRAELVSGLPLLGMYCHTLCLPEMFPCSSNPLTIFDSLVLACSPNFVSSMINNNDQQLPLTLNWPNGGKCLILLMGWKLLR